MAEREQDVMRGQWADPNKIDCTTCIWRDMETVELDGKILPVGATRCFCERFPKGEMYKPTAVLFNGEHCDYYLEE